MVEDGPEEGRELGRRHLAGRHREFLVNRLAEPRDVAGDPHIVGRVREDGLGLCAAQKRFIALAPGGVAAQQKMLADLPEVAGPA